MNSASGASASRLEQRTELNRLYAEYEAAGPHSSDSEELMRAVNVRDYGGGVVEVGYSSVQMVPPVRKARKHDPEKNRSVNLARSLRRSKAQVRRKCMAGGLDHLLTLTYRENVSDLETAFCHFKRFVRLVRERLPEWKYVAVPEFHDSARTSEAKRGSIHFHCAVQGFQDVRWLRTCWLAVVGDGNIDVKGPRLRGSCRWKLAKLAGYLSKYITKNSGIGGARQRYRVAEGIEIPSRVFVHRFPAWTDFMAELFDSLGVPLTHHWKAEGAQHGWACSW